MGRPALPGRNTPTYNSWGSMKDRCFNHKNPNWARYGGRGISVCDWWAESFDNFLRDVGERPSLAHTIERIDNDGDYEPVNCRWATKVEQSRNTRVAVRLTYRGETKALNEWARIVGLSWPCLKGRYDRGWTTEAIIETPSVPPRLRRSHERGSA
jgi:hypothetical protein